jgi:hypothetical protein
MASFNYVVNVTGDCQNDGTGSIQVGFSGGTPPYTVQWISPYNSGDIFNYLAYDYSFIDPTSYLLTYSVLTNLSANTYTFRVTRLYSTCQLRICCKRSCFIRKLYKYYRCFCNNM